MYDINKIKLARYRRKSTDSEDKQVASLDDQKKQLEETERRHSVRVRLDLHESRSAKKPGRPEFNRLIELIRTGEIDGIVCWHIDRLTRNPQDSGTLMQLLQDGVLKAIITPPKTYFPDDDALTMAIEAGMANQYSRNLSRNVKRGLQSRAEKGIYPVGPKPGYIYDPTMPRGQKVLLPDSTRFELLRDAVLLVVSGKHTTPKALDILNNKWGYRSRIPIKSRKLGGKPLPRSSFYQVLADPFYYGEYEYPAGSGNWYKGIHQPMITKEQFNRIQILLGKKSRPKLIRHDFPFTGGLMTCGGCGGAITGEDKWQCRCTICHHKFSCKNSQTCPNCETPIEKMKNPTLRHYIYYRCAKKVNPVCVEGFIEQKVLVGQVNDFLSRIAISERFKQWLIRKVNEENQNEVQARNIRLRSLQSAYNQTIESLDRLRGQYISPQNADGLLFTPEEYKADKQRLNEEKQRLESELNKLGMRVDEWSDIVERTFNFARFAHYWFEHGEKTDQRAILNALSLNLVLKDRKLQINDPSVFLSLKNAQVKVPSILEKFEPALSGLNHYKLANLETSWDKNPDLLATPVSNPKSDTGGGF